jgi:hypothetical protein
MTQYTGICVVKIDNVVVQVRVRDPFGNELFISLDDYIGRGVKPDYTHLPECK